MSEKYAFYNDPSINLVDPKKWDEAKSILRFITRKVADVADISEDLIQISRPNDPDFGDFSTNYALKQSKILGKSPMQIAEDLVEKLSKNEELSKYFSKIEFVKPGFVNFYLTDSFLYQEIEKLLISTNETIYQGILKDKKILLEYAHPNPFKAFHIGHLRNIILGESLIRLLEACGAKVIRTNYQGDVGMHVAKSIWGMISLFEENKLDIKMLEKNDSSERVQFLGKAYAKGAAAYSNDKNLMEEIKDINYLVYAVAQELEMTKYDWVPKVKYKDFIESTKFNFDQIKELWITGVRWSLEYLREKIYPRLYSSFNREYMESETQYFTEKNIERAIQMKVLEKSQGAYILNGKTYGLNTAVFENSLGLPTYEGKELGLAPMEFGDHGEIDLSIHNVAVEQISFFKATFKVKELLNPEKFKGKMYHNAYEFVGLKKGKMSSRTGNVVLGESILNEAHDKIYQIITEREGLSETEKQETAEKIAVGAVKYSFLNISPFSYLAFDLDTSLNFEGNSGPYLQYSFARANKIVSDAKLNIDELDPNSIESLISAAEKKLIRHLLMFSDTIIDSTKMLAPNILCSYLFELAQNFNLFYKTSNILKEPDGQIKAGRILLTDLTKKTLEKGLYLLGIKTVEKM